MTLRIQKMPQVCKYTKDMPCIAAGKLVFYGSCMGCAHEGDKIYEPEPKGKKKANQINRHDIKKKLVANTNKKIKELKKTRTEEEIIACLSKIVG